MKTRTFIRILLTVAIVVFTAIASVVFVSIAERSHHISDESRDNAITRGLLAIGFGVILIAVVWIPWRRMGKGHAEN